MSKITHTKKVIEDQYVFISDFKVKQEVIDGIQTSAYIIDELQTSIEKIHWVKQERKNHFGCMAMD